jgi:hypothetical protein
MQKNRVKKSTWRFLHHRRHPGAGAFLVILFARRSCDIAAQLDRAADPAACRSCAGSCDASRGSRRHRFR